MQTARIVKLEKFYVHKSDYGQFRRNILQKLDKYCSEYTDIPVVGPKMPNVSNWIMIEVISKDCEVVLPICADTLYLVGWKKGKLHEGFPWFIAAGEMKRVVLKGKKEELPFTGNYRAVGDPHSAFIDRETLDWAVSTLCSYKNSSGPGALDAFRIMILMFCAGVRIIPIYRAIYQATQHGVVGHCISVEDTSRERNWKAVSEVYLSGKEGKEVSGYGIVSYDCMKTNLSVLLYYSRGEHKLTKGRGWQSVTPPRRRDRGKRTKKGDSGADTSSHRGSGSVQESSGSGSVNFKGKGKANNFGGRKSIMTPDVEDNKIIVPRNSLVEVNWSGLLMETIIDITPWDPLPTPSAGPLDPNCAKEGLILCDRDRIKGQTGVSLDALVGIFTWLGREMEGNGVSNSYKLAEKVASIMQVAQPLLEKKLKAIAEDVKPLLSEVQDSALIKDVEIITKSLGEGTKYFRRLQSSVLIPENSDLVGQSVYSLIFTLKNIESRCVNMIAHCFSATMGVGTVKSSKAMLAGLTFKMLAGQNKRKAEGKPCDKPKIVTGANVQFARYFEVKLKEVKLKEGYYIMDLEKAVEMVEDNTICVASVLGSTLAGEFEDVNKLNELLTQKNKEIGVDISRSLAERLADIQKVVEEFSEQVKQVPKAVTAQVSITARSGGADGALVHKREQEIAEEMVT